VTRPAARLARVGLVVAAAGLLLVGRAAPAAAHVLGAGGRPSNYRTEVSGVTPPVPGLTVRVLEAGSQLELVNRTGQEVVVLGYRSEPYLRVGPTGVYENRRSPSAYSNRFANPPSRIPAELDPAAPPQWRRLGGGARAVWHDHRAHWSGPDPAAVRADRGRSQVVMPSWHIPLRVGDRTALIQGDIVWVPGPSPWPWALLALAAFAALASAGWRRRLLPLVLLSLLAVAADVTHTVGAFAASTASVLTSLYAASTSVAGWVVAGVAVHRLLRGRLESGWVLLLLAGVFLAVAGALPDVGALGSSQVSSALDPDLTRAAIALTLGLGAGMVVTGLLGLRAADRSRSRPPARW
jgi:hypothetical protein